MKYPLFLILIISSQVYAENQLCEQPKNEHPYHLHEDDFTEKNYKLAINSLNTAYEAKAYDWDFYDVESDLMYIKGYMYKLHIKQNPNSKILLKEFCSFMAKEAYARHE